MKKPTRTTAQDLSPEEMSEAFKEAVRIVKRRRAMETKEAKGIPTWKKLWKLDYAGQTATCPACGKDKLIDDEFGPRRYRGKVGRQSYCRECRKAINYHNRPRVYNTQNS